MFSLFDLAKFIQDADGGLMQPVVEGNYEVLVSVMGYLYNVKERQATTDEMFQPLTDTIQLLKYYDMELSEEVNVLLQVLNELTHLLRIILNTLYHTIIFRSFLNFGITPVN